MTVKELIEILSTANPEASVIVDGFKYSDGYLTSSVEVKVTDVEVRITEK